ncbi:iron uptake porin [Tumidithrix elongata RA019]|uniref:Iron uptake porin n=1 Tax=Tumidithrix elongata BACA0141 TaxID=2716417 RepID=A0AAW9Q1J6_9CYAN|nr:iron uptake porin [Tumidithrix elongata RA019]
MISAGLADKVSKEDLAALQKLQEEFAAELATLRGRVDALEAKTAKLEAQQFSTTTKLYGQAIFGVQARTSNTADLSPRGDGLKDSVDPATNLTFGYNVQLSLATQFDPRSLLLTGLQMGNLSSSIGTFGGTTGSAFLSNTFTRLGYELDTGGAVQLSDLSYRHLIADNFAIIVGPVGVNPVTVFRGPNRYENAGQGAISAFAQRNPILNLGNTTAGLGFDWQIAPRVSLQAVYSAGDVANPTGSGGLFGGPTTIGAQLSLTPAETVDVALYYLNSYVTSPSLNTGVGDNLIGPIGSRYNTNAFGASVNWQISPKVTFGLWGGYTSSNLVGSSIAIPGLQGTVETTNWMAYFNFPNLFNDGDLLGIYVGQPPKITSSNINVSGFPAFNVPSAIGLPGVASGDVGGQPASTTHLEAFYRFRVTKNISITPGILVLFNPVHTSTSDTITIGTLRTTFTF